MRNILKKIKETYSSRDIAVSFQHMFAMLGATIMVPLACGMNVSMTMLAVGIGTICFHFIAKKKVPVFLGSSFAFLGAYLTIIDGASFTTEYDLWCQNMGKLAGAIIIAGVVYMLFSVLIKLVGVEKIKKAFPPIVIGPVIMLIGFTLIPNMFWNDVVKQFVVFNVEPWAVWSSFLITIITIFIINSYTKPKSILKVMPIICGFGVGYIYCLILSLCGVDGIINFTAFEQMNTITVFGEMFTKNSVFGFWKYFTFDMSAIFAVVPVAIVAIMEHLGDISANSVVCGKDFFVDPGIDKTMLGDGIAVMIAGCLGAPSVTTYSENTAILAMTKNYKPTNVLFAAIVTVILGLFTPIAAFFQTIPAPVIGGASIVLFGMISVSGMRDLIDNKIDMGEMKNILVVSLSVAIGLGIGFLSLFGDVLTALISSGKILSSVNPEAFKIMVGGIELSALALSTLTAIILNFIIPNLKNEDSKNKSEAEILDLIENKQEVNKSEQENEINKEESFLTTEEIE